MFKTVSLACFAALIVATAALVPSSNLVIGGNYAYADSSLPTDDDTSPADSSPAPDDDASPYFALSGTANGFSPPIVLAAYSRYEFAFEAFNNAPAGNSIAIKKVDISLPNTNYALNTATLAAPAAKHPDRGSWQVNFVAASATITWEFQGAISSVEFGDIESGESLVFPFTATTDAGATDGFAWRLTGDDAAGTDAYGVFYFTEPEPPPDDDAATVTGCGC